MLAFTVMRQCEYEVACGYLRTRTDMGLLNLFCPSYSSLVNVSVEYTYSPTRGITAVRDFVYQYVVFDSQTYCHEAGLAQGSNQCLLIAGARFLTSAITRIATDASSCNLGHRQQFCIQVYTDCVALTFRHRASCIQDRRFAVLSRERLFIYLINKYISLSDTCLTVHH